MAAPSSATALSFTVVTQPEFSPVQESRVVQDVLQPKQVVMLSAPTPALAPVEEIVNETPQNCDPSEEELVAAVKALDGSLSDAKVREYLAIVNPLSVEYGIEPLWVFAMMFQESSFDERVVSSHGAIGLMQLMPSTAKDVFGVSKSELYDPETNIMLGVQYLAQLREGYAGDLQKAIIAYNQGVTNVNKGKYTTKYYLKVKKHYDKVESLINTQNGL
jgi:soluble lytic murein transglycosylase-like protein